MPAYYDSIYSQWTDLIDFLFLAYFLDQFQRAPKINLKIKEIKTNKKLYENDFFFRKIVHLKKKKSVSHLFPSFY